jgi:hypothetical protein
MRRESNLGGGASADEAEPEKVEVPAPSMKVEAPI